MPTDAFLHERLRELTRHYVSPNPMPVHLQFGELGNIDFHEFELSILESAQEEQGQRWRVLTSIMCQRQKGQLDSVYEPLCCVLVRCGHLAKLNTELSAIVRSQTNMLPSNSSIERSARGLCSCSAAHVKR